MNARNGAQIGQNRLIETDAGLLFTVMLRSQPNLGDCDLAGIESFILAQQMEKTSREQPGHEQQRSATCSPISHWCKRRPCRVPNVRLLDCCSHGCGSAVRIRNAGNVPARRLALMVRVTEKSRTEVLRWTSASLGRPTGRSRRKKLSPAAASRMPATPPSAVNRKFSATAFHTRRHLAAPSG